jgi:Na+/melibiose symporter-like transporter
VIGAILIMKNYDITEEKAAQIKKELTTNKKE